MVLSDDIKEEETSKQKVRTIVSLALPSIVENILQTAVGVANAVLAIYISILEHPL